MEKKSYLSPCRKKTLSQDFDGTANFFYPPPEEKVPIGPTRPMSLVSCSSLRFASACQIPLPTFQIISQLFTNFSLDWSPSTSLGNEATDILLALRAAPDDDQEKFFHQRSSVKSPNRHAISKRSLLRIMSCVFPKLGGTCGCKLRLTTCPTL